MMASGILKQNNLDIRKKRIPTELKKMSQGFANHGILCKPKSDGDFSSLEAVIPGPKNSPYEGGKFKLNIEISFDYPFKPPIIKFVTRMYHPNIDNAGKICLDILQSNGSYSPAITLESILISIQLLLANPNPDDPLQSEIAEMYKNHRDEYEKKAKEYTQKYAKDIEEINDEKVKNEDNSSEEIAIKKSKLA